MSDQEENQPIAEDEFFAEELSTDSGNNTTQKIVETFKEVRSAEAEILQLGALLEGLTGIVSKAKTVTFPALLQELGTEIWRDPETGIAVELVTAVNSSLPKDIGKRNAVLDALRPIGVEEIMAEEFTVTFSPNDRRAHIVRALLGLNPPPVLEDEEPGGRLTNLETEMIWTLRNELGLTESDLPAEEKLGVHASRLGAWLREKIAKGFGSAITDAGIWHGKHAKLVVPKDKGKK